MVLTAIFALSTSTALAGGWPYDGQNPGQGNPCNTFQDLPGTAKPIYLNNQQYGTFVVRVAVGNCAVNGQGIGRLSEVQFSQKMGYKIHVWQNRDWSATNTEDYTVMDNGPGVRNPVFTAMWVPGMYCTAYGADVTNPATGETASISTEICDYADGYPGGTDVTPPSGDNGVPATPVPAPAPAVTPAPVPAAQPVAVQPKPKAKKKAKKRAHKKSKHAKKKHKKSKKHRHTKHKKHVSRGLSGTAD